MNTQLRDELTGALRNESFTADLEAFCEFQTESMIPFSIAMLDIDRFLEVNETYGHDYGDIVLAHIAKHLMDNMERNGKVYRYSGDEFAVLLPKTEKEQAFLLIETIRNSLSFENAQPRGHTNGEPVSVGFSGGIATYPDDSMKPTELIRKAEGAMFRAKKGSASRICLARDDKMVAKTSHYTVEQLKMLTELAKKEGISEAILLREALDDLLRKYDK